MKILELFKTTDEKLKDIGFEESAKIYSDIISHLRELMAHKEG